LASLLDVPRNAIAHLRASDPVLAGVIRTVGPCRFQPTPDGTHFGSLVKAIVFQQLSGKAAGTIHSRLLALFGGICPTPAEVLGAEEQTLRQVGLSRQKVLYLRDLAARVEAGAVPLDAIDQLSDEEVIVALTHVKGIGRWTAQMFLMFRLGRPDVLPEGDLGIQKAVMQAYNLSAMPTPSKLRTIAAGWTPYRTTACWYLWRSLDNGGGQL
jgi:DNA-3-methyladenine glycosylase II